MSSIIILFLFLSDTDLLPQLAKLKTQNTKITSQISRYMPAPPSCKTRSYCAIITETKNYWIALRSAGFSIRVLTWPKIHELLAPSPQAPARDMWNIDSTNSNVFSIARCSGWCNTNRASRHNNRKWKEVKHWGTKIARPKKDPAHCIKISTITRKKYFHKLTFHFRGLCFQHLHVGWQLWSSCVGCTTNSSPTGSRAPGGNLGARHVFRASTRGRAPKTCSPRAGTTCSFLHLANNVENWAAKAQKFRFQWNGHVFCSWTQRTNDQRPM